MEDTRKVFFSDIIRSEIQHKNNLYELLNVVPAVPLKLNDVKNNTCDFIPRTGKIYIPKRRPMVKVKTVRDIRADFEKETYAYLRKDLESQHNYLLKRIRDGSAKNENTLKVAKKILKGDKPLTRSIWQMLQTINPENHTHPRQFVLWNGTFIQVNGSRGGKDKLICNYDLASTKELLKMRKSPLRNDIPVKKKGLLRNSLAIKFKPGPLGRKKFLDDSHQKYHGDIELVDLPKVGLAVQPTYGTALEPSITHVLSNLREEDGTISGKWAEYAVSVFGKIDNSNAKLVNSEPVTFDLKYKCDQHRILMRKDIDNSYFTPKLTSTPSNISNTAKDQFTVLSVVKDMMNKIIDAVDININQDKMLTSDENSEQIKLGSSNTIDITSFSKDKTKRRYCELDRLDVTVIRLPEISKRKSTQTCENLHCSLGCICDSLKCTQILRNHCGRESCMFDCKCDFPKYISINSQEEETIDLVPAIINIEDEINKRLAKEEQKFHQTVIVTGEQNILLKSASRNCKTSKKNIICQNTMGLRNINHNNAKIRELSVSLLKLNCENIQPWCMVHNLYKCFCKGRFTESSNADLFQNIAKEPIQDRKSMDAISDADCSTEPPARQFLRSRVRQEGVNYLDKSIKTHSCSQINNRHSDKTSESDLGSTRENPAKIKYKTKTLNSNAENSDNNADKIYEDKSASESNDFFNYYYSDYNGTCSRVIAYEGRKYSDEHYKNTNYRIKEMEANDKNLQQRMMCIKMNSVIEDDPSAGKQNEIITAKGQGKSKILTKDLNKMKKSAKYPEIEKLLLEDPENEITEAKDHENSESVAKVSEIEKSPSKEPEAELQSKSAQDGSLVKFLFDSNGFWKSDAANPKKSVPLDRKLQCEDNIVGWLESNYKLYKNRIDEGLIKSSLEPPKIGKVALHSWEFILSRYRERKNLFLISKQTPYRIFMGVHTRNPFFESCININEIRFMDLHKYPQTVKNLLTNATDLKDNFCILRGLAHCWELAGSVAKVNGEENNDETSDIESNPLSNYSDLSDEQPTLSCTEKNDIQSFDLRDDQDILECSAEADSSKWFVMTVENDFSEIRFYKKGFFVKYESIVKAINVARMSGKTVRLSSQKCVDKSSGPQFGVYAIPNASEYCVFIGPYEMQDSLGIETIKSILDVRKSKGTRGFWINTNKVDNLKVIDNPLSFMPLTNAKKNEAVPLESHFCEEKSPNQNGSPESHNTKELEESQHKTPPKPENKKIVKPIKIRKTNGFYHLATDGLLKKITLQSPPKVSIGAPLQNSCLVGSPDLMTKSSFLETIPKSNTPNIENVLSTNNTTTAKDLHIDAASQIKITAVYSQREVPKVLNKKKERGMLILKPEEINRKMLEGQINAELTSSPEFMSNVTEVNTNSRVVECPLVLNEDLPASATLTPGTSNADICVISDDEDDIMTVSEAESSGCWKDVLIQCTNFTDLGWIYGRKMCDSLLISFKVPGGPYSAFYTEEDAFMKLNQELSAIVAPSKPFNLSWKVVDLTDNIQGEINPIEYELLQRVFGELGNQSSNAAAQN